jgi:hypothetical protein
MQVPYKPYLEEEPGGDPQATYAYTAADVGAKQRGVYEGAEVRQYAKYKPRKTARCMLLCHYMPGWTS